MPDRRFLALQLRIGGFVLVSLGVFLAIIYLLGARARYFESKYGLVADQMAILLDGNFADIGTPAEIHRSANPDVRRFLAGELREI